MSLQSKVNDMEKLSILLLITLQVEIFWSPLKTANCHSILMPEGLINIFTILLEYNIMCLREYVYLYLYMFVCPCVCVYLHMHMY